MTIPPGGQMPYKTWQYEVRQKKEDVAIQGSYITRYIQESPYTVIGTVIDAANESGTVTFPGPLVKLDVKCCTQ